MSKAASLKLSGGASYRRVPSATWSGDHSVHLPVSLFYSRSYTVIDLAL